MSIEADQFTFDAAFNHGPVYHVADSKHIQKVADKMGIRMTTHQAEEVWDWYSGRRCASWLNLGDDEEIEQAITGFIEYRLNPT